jgi:hypothetical protein
LQTIRSPASGQWSCQHVAALALSSQFDTNPPTMIRAHGLLIAHLNVLQLRNYAADDFARIVVQAWTRIADRPFLLRNPQLTVPAIKALINSDLSGMAMVKAVLVAALDAVPITADDPARIAINNLSV